MFGQNRITKKESKEDGLLNVNSMFYTIQGEGPNAGCPAYFIRLSGCNLRCSWCDTEFEKGDLKSIESIVTHVLQDMSAYCEGCPVSRLVVITGGEPMLQADLPDLVKRLLVVGLKVQIETAGTVWQKGLESIDIYSNPDFQIVCSPKTGKIHSMIEQRVNAYKYVLRAGCVDQSDGLPNVSPETGKSIILHRPKDRRAAIYVMPCDEHDEVKNTTNEMVCVKSAMKHGYKICLQMHKHLGLE